MVENWLKKVNESTRYHHVCVERGQHNLPVNKLKYIHSSSLKIGLYPPFSRSWIINVFAIKWQKRNYYIHMYYYLLILHTCEWIVYLHIDTESICLEINVMGTKAGDADLLTLQFEWRRLHGAEQRASTIQKECNLEKLHF